MNRRPRAGGFFVGLFFVGLFSSDAGESKKGITFGLNLTTDSPSTVRTLIVGTAVGIYNAVAFILLPDISPSRLAHPVKPVS